MTDFVLDFPEGKEIKILQVTDTQIIDSSQCRYPTRLSESQKQLWLPKNIEVRMGKYLRGAVEKSDPDVIVHTGDFSYGEFDDIGSSFEKHIEIMDAFQKPWCLALGNHERETYKGTDYLCDRLEKAKYGLFKGRKENCEGRGNYSVLLRRGGKAVAVLYMLDSGAGTAEIPAGIYEGQRAWLKEVANTFQGVPAYAFFHIPPYAAAQKLKKYGYAQENFIAYTIPKNADGDVGFVGEWGHERLYIDKDGSLMQLFEEIGVKGVFVGHIHEHAYTVRCGKLLVTHGVKTGEYDSHDKAHLGGTLLRILEKDNDFVVEEILIG